MTVQQPEQQPGEGVVVCWRGECRDGCFYPDGCSERDTVPASPDAGTGAVEALDWNLTIYPQVWAIYTATGGQFSAAKLALYAELDKVLAAHDAEVAAAAEAAAGERIAKAIEATVKDAPQRERGWQWNIRVADAARIAREEVN